ncbi:uncharacterized protein [Clytia hemisphaerica]|uniref:uncharacterized protein n=1 Tax=Clytia hemisphaerica TaxID=252671 RepID=UPI0034D7BA6C
MTEEKNSERKTAEAEIVNTSDNPSSSEVNKTYSEDDLQSPKSSTPKEKEGNQSNEQEEDSAKPSETKTNEVRIQGGSSTVNRTIERQNMGFTFFSKRFSLHSLGSSFEKKSLSSIPECEEYSTKEKNSVQEKCNTQQLVTPKKKMALKPIMKKTKQNGKEHTIIPLLNKSDNQTKKSGQQNGTNIIQNGTNNGHRGNIRNQDNGQPTTYQIVCQTMNEYGVGKSILIISLVILLCVGGYLFGLLMKTKS